MLRVGEGRRMKRMHSTSEYITTLEPDFVKLSDAELAAKTAEYEAAMQQAIDEVSRLDAAAQPAEVVLGAFHDGALAGVVRVESLGIPVSYVPGPVRRWAIA